MSKIIVIVGPTGIGKTKLSISLAKKYDADIISADSVQIFKELNIGSAKISEEEKQGITHYMINIKSINQTYSVFDYQKEAREILNQKIKQNKNIVIVGGTGLYIKAVLYDYKFDKENTNRKFNKTNKKLYDFEIIGLTTSREEVYDRINKRVDLMFENGLLEEAKTLYKINPSFTNRIIGYKELNMFFDKKLSLEETKELIKKNSRNYAKRQCTWNNNQFDVSWFEVKQEFNKTIKEVISYIDDKN